MLDIVNPPLLYELPPPCRLIVQCVRFVPLCCRSPERDRYGRLRQYGRRSMSRDRDRRRRRSRDEDKFKGSLSEGMKVERESSGEEV